jgi:hypothetical protein
MEPVPVTIGAEVSCTDEVCGRVTRVVIDPVARAVTHLVVAPRHLAGLGRLVPIDVCEIVGPDQVRLTCSLAEFEQMDSAEESEFVPAPAGFGDYGPPTAMAWPYYGLGTGGVTVSYDAVPVGEVELRRGSPVHATDGSIGHVDGLILEPRGHQVTHVLLTEGHLWGRKQVAIPVGAVGEVDAEGIRLRLTKQQVADLPPVDIEQQGG